MPRYAEKIAKTEERLEQQRQRLRDLKAQETAQERKDDTRRKILYGAAFLSMLKQFSEERRQASLEAIHKVITRKQDRDLLGLEPIDDPAKADTETGSDPNVQTEDLPFGDFKT